MGKVRNAVESRIAYCYKNHHLNNPLDRYRMKNLKTVFNISIWGLALHFVTCSAASESSTTSTAPPIATYKNIDDFKQSLKNSKKNLLSLTDGTFNKEEPAKYVALIGKDHKAEIVVLTTYKNNELYTSEITSELSTEGLTITLSKTGNQLHINVDAIRSTFIHYVFESSKEKFKLTHISAETSSISDDENQTISSVETEFNVKTGNIKFERTGDLRVSHMKIKPPQCFLSEFTFSVDFCTYGISTPRGNLTDLMWPEN